MNAIANVYRHDKRTAIMCRRMQERGFRFDPERGAVLSERLRQLEAEAINDITNTVGYTIKPNSSKQLQWALFDVLEAPVYYRTAKTRQPALGVDSMRAYAMSADARLRNIALAVLRYRRAHKIRSTYIDNIHIGLDGRVHPVWLNYGTVSGRWSCQEPNLMNLPHPTRDPTLDLGGVRSLYIPADGYKLIMFDFAQVEMRIAAYASGDANMINACESSDLHASNAALIFGSAFNTEAYAAGARDANDAEFKALKFLRQLAKSAGFAICYGADENTVHTRIVADGADVSLQRVAAMLRKIRARFIDYYRWQDVNINACIRDGYVSSPILGRRRYLGHAPSPTEVMNFPIQSGAADLINGKLCTIDQRLPEGAHMVAQVHDSATYEVREDLVSQVEALIDEVCAQPVSIAASGTERAAVYPIERECVERWN